MALTIITQPPAIAPVRQPHRLVLQTNNYQLSAGTKAKLRINHAGSTDGTTFTLTIANKAYVFTAKTSPDANSAFEFQASGDSEISLANVVTMLEENPFIFDNYIINSNTFPFWFELEAKVVGELWTMGFAASNSQFTLAENTAGVSATFRPNFKVLLYFSAAGTKVLKDARVMANMQCEFILEELLDNFVNTPLPGSMASGGILHLVEPLSYTLGYAESYGTDPLVQKRISIYKKALPGLFSKTEYPTAVLADYISAPLDRKFWSSRPERFAIKPHQFFMMAHYNAIPFDSLSFSLLYILKREDGFLSAPVAMNLDDVFEVAAEGIACVYMTLNWLCDQLDIDPSQLYEVRLGMSWVESINPGNKYRSAYIFAEVDQTAPENEVMLLFKAASGLFELVYFEGDTDTEVQTTRSFADHLLPANYTVAGGEIREVEVTRQKRYVLHSGLKKRDYIVWLQELVGSEEVYLLAPDLVTKTRVNIVNHTDDLTSTNQELHSMNITIQEAFIDRS